jgi:hypothetical protein
LTALEVHGDLLLDAVEVGTGEEYDARARWVCPQNASRIKKEVAINCGWVGEARAGRVFNLKFWRCFPSPIFSS